LLTLYKGDLNAILQMDCLNDENIEEYFKILKETLLENLIIGKSAQICIAGESDMPWDHHTPNVISKKGQKKVC